MRTAGTPPGTPGATNNEESVNNEIKKSSFYVVFLGAREAKGLRGVEYIVPVMRLLGEKKDDSDPFKLTLQVSPKGLKIVQNTPGAKNAPFDMCGKLNSSGSEKPDPGKQCIPHHAVTTVHQKGELVGCIVLLYDNYAKCPLHVHVYRCDSVKTATVLYTQLKFLIERPENQKKVHEMESKLVALGAYLNPQRRRLPPNGSETRSARESESSGSSSGGRQEKIAHLFESLAVELKERLGTGGPQAAAPILLPPRDYDTVHRQKGNLSEINARRCLNMNIVGMNATPSSVEGATALKPPTLAKGSSGGSSGIGSDHAPSPDQEHHDTRFLDNESSSDEDWNADPYKEPGCSGSGGHGGSWRNSGSGDLSLPRARRFNSSESAPTSPARRSHDCNADVSGYRRSREYPPQEDRPIQPDFPRVRRRLPNIDRIVEPPFQTGSDSNQMVGQWRRKNAEDRQRSPSPSNSKSVTGSLTPRDRFNDAKEKFLSLEKEKQEERERQEKALANERRRANQPIEPPISPAVMPVARNRLTKSWSRSRDSDEDFDESSQQGYSPVDESYGQPRGNDEREYHQNSRREPSYLKSQSHGSTPDSEDFPVRGQGKINMPFSRREEQQRNFNPSPSRRNIDNHNFSSMPPENSRQGPPTAQRRYASPRRDLSPDVRPRIETTSPTKESPRRSPRKVPVLDQSQLEELKKRFGGKVPRSYFNTNPVPFAESDSEIPLERYRSPTRMNPPPRPSPRHQQRYPTPDSDEEDERRDYRAMMHLDHRSPEHRNFPSRAQLENEMKRRSIYESIEDERRRNSHELAKEFKRRSVQEPGPSMDSRLGYQELDERERYPGLDRETARVHPVDESAVPITSPRYRHSYAEPFQQYKPAGQPPHEMLHRTNSSLSSGRIGMAAIHPY